MEHFKTCTEQRKARTCPVTRGDVPIDWKPNVNTDLRDMVDGFVREIKEDEAEETVADAAAQWAGLLGLCTEYDAAKATLSTAATVSTGEKPPGLRLSPSERRQRSQRSPRSPRSRVSHGPFTVDDEEDFHFVPSPALGPEDFTLRGCTVETLNYPGRKFLVTDMNPDGSFSVTELPISPRSATLTAAECFLMTVHVTPEAKNKNKRIKIVFNKYREPPESGGYSGAVQRVIGLTGLTGVISGFDHDNAIVKVDNDGSVLIVPLRHCAEYTAA
jgi:hypothetical protein